MEKDKVVPINSVPSPNSALAKKIMSDLLFEHYDLTARDYKEGWTDERIAKESGLSVEFVTQRRAADYGPVSPPRPPAYRQAITVARSAALNLATIEAQAQNLAAACRAEIKRVEGEIARIEFVETKKAARA